MRSALNLIITISVVFLIVIVLLIVSGQQGCDLGGGGTQAKLTGIDFNLISGVDYLSAGKLLQQGESFYVGVKIENYDKVHRSGELCISDNVADTYGGVSSQGKGECKQFSVKAADIIKKESRSITGSKIVEQVVPGVVEVYFPEEGIFSYHDLPVSQQPWPQMFYASLRYRETSQATATVVVPTPAYEQLNLVQEPAPIFMTATKSIHKMQDAYKVDLEIALKKQQQARIFSSDFNKENVTYFFVQLAPQALQCVLPNGQPVTGAVEMGNEKLIKCSSLVYLTGEVQQSYPLIISLDYGVAIEKQYPFGIKTK